MNAKDELDHALRQHGFDPSEFRLAIAPLRQFKDAKLMLTVTCGRTRVCRTYLSSDERAWADELRADIRADVFGAPQAA